MKIKLFFITSVIIISSLYNIASFANVSKGCKEGDKDFSFIRNFKVTEPLNLKISTSGGNISTTGRADNDAEVAFIVAKRGKVLDITFDHLKEYAEVEITNDNSNLEIKVKKIYEHNISVGFSIKTPVKSSVTLNTSGGNISVLGISGNHNINTSGGNISLASISGTVDAKTSGGNVSISNSSAVFNASTSGGNISTDNIDGKLVVSTSGGNINATDIKNGFKGITSGGNIYLHTVLGPVEVSTSGGCIELYDISGSVKANTSGGSIKAKIIKLSENLYFETSGGSINATIPNGLGLNLDLSADNINTTFVNFTGTAKRNTVKGQINGGGIPVHMSTSGGSINLDYK